MLSQASDALPTVPAMTLSNFAGGEAKLTDERSLLDESRLTA